jgi:hypothetical protein
MIPDKIKAALSEMPSMARRCGAGSPEDLPLWWLTRFLLTRFGAIYA